jgi:hypothetical protein
MSPVVFYRTIKIDDLSIFYRETSFICGVSLTEPELKIGQQLLQAASSTILGFDG